MVSKAFFAASLVVGGVFSTGIAHADYIQNLGTYAGDVIAQLQGWGYNVMLNGLDRDIAYMDETQKRHCQVLGVNPTVSGPVESGTFQTIFVTLSCPSNPSSSVSSP